MSIVSLNAALSTPAADSWGAKVDASIARYRASLRKPVVEAPAGPVPFTGDPADPAFLYDEQFYVRFERTPELVKARLDAVSANIARVDAQLDGGSFAVELVEAVKACECRDDSDIPADDPIGFDNEDRWEQVWTTTEEVEAPAPLTPITFYPLNHPTRRADADDLARAHEAGFQLGSDGFTIRDVAPPAYMTAAECDHFMAGLEAGEARLWADFAADMEVMADREAAMEALWSDPYLEVNEAELAAAGCC